MTSSQFAASCHRILNRRMPVKASIKIRTIVVVEKTSRRPPVCELANILPVRHKTNMSQSAFEKRIQKRITIRIRSIPQILAPQSVHYTLTVKRLIRTPRDILVVVRIFDL
ncbi:hypothetical protein B9Z55_024201 [Caenorhabditis nigoni]|uniref:Uncharacterized protein n=1 Tax=Caenorhabditis nigoni TaxID=1611254 RepID=A0A2G5STF5_9PELO|nr:hypothetical protein B9Z55_024201 [Caenorhabditis nigoni]